MKGMFSIDCPICPLIYSIRPSDKLLRKEGNKRQRSSSELEADPWCGCWDMGRAVKLELKGGSTPLGVYSPLLWQLAVRGQAAKRPD